MLPLLKFLKYSLLHIRDYKFQINLKIVNLKMVRKWPFWMFREVPNLKISKNFRYGNN